MAELSRVKADGGQKMEEMGKENGPLWNHGGGQYQILRAEKEQISLWMD